jgi:hypothetical protein
MNLVDELEIVLYVGWRAKVNAIYRDNVLAAQCIGLLSGYMFTKIDSTEDYGTNKYFVNKHSRP